MSDKLSNFYPGESLDITLTLTLNGAAVDIHADTLTLRVKRSPLDTDVQAVLTATADCATYGASGKAVWSVTPASTDDITPEVYWYDIVWERASGKERVVLTGQLTVNERVSDA